MNLLYFFTWNLIKCLKIQDVRTQKFFLVVDDSVDLVSNPILATSFDLEYLPGSMTESMIKQRGSGRSLDYEGGGKRVIMFAAEGAPSQKFTFSMNQLGNYEIVNACSKYMYVLDDTHIEGGVRPHSSRGFKILNDDGRTDYFGFIRNYDALNPVSMENVLIKPEIPDMTDYKVKRLAYDPEIRAGLLDSEIPE